MDLTGSLPPDLATAAQIMRGFPAPWCIAGGWALDLFLGRLTRAHADVDVALFRDDQTHLHRHLAAWRFSKVVGGTSTAWTAEEWLSWPVHEVYAQAPKDRSLRLEFLLNERAGAYWIFRRDPAVRRPVDQVMYRSAAGLPVLCPAVVLLYKAKQPRAADALDFAAVLKHLALERRVWLRAALEQVHPGHPWLADLELGRRGA